MPKEVAALFDTSGSMDEYVASGIRITKKQLATDIARRLVAQTASADSQDPDEVTPDGKHLGGLFTVTFSSRALPVGKGNMHLAYPGYDDAEEHAGDLNTENFEILWPRIKWGGGTYIMPGITFQMNHYHEEFDDLPEEQKPTLVLWVITDGALDTEEYHGNASDEAKFRDWLSTTQDRVLVGCVVVGSGFGHDDAVRQWTAIAKTHPNVKVFPTNGSNNVETIVSTLLSLAD